MSFNWKIYRALNPDLIAVGLNTQQQLERHYNVHGKDEKRITSIYQIYPDFNPDVYRAIYNDLSVLNNEDLQLHWINHGRHENRIYVQQNKLKISVHLMGGLCNRMYQIACAYVLSIKYNKDLIIFSKTDNPHSKINYFENIFRKINTNWSLNINNVYREPDNTAQLYNEIPNFTEDTMIYGYFQHYMYINNYRNEVLRLFEMENDRRTRLINMYNNLNNSYFLHIRRGDYVNNSYHELNLTNYYKKALSSINMKDCTVYVFSDDINYCKNIDWLKGANIRYIEGLDEIDSLYLMSLCNRGGICCNSSFSWWGAYMINNPNKKVFFPNKWFPNDNIRTDIGWPGCTILEI